QLQLLKDALSVGRQGFQGLLRVLGTNQVDQLDFVELMLTDHAAHIPSIAAGFTTETRGMASIAGRQLSGVQNTVPGNVGDGYFRSRDQVIVPFARNL